MALPAFQANGWLPEGHHSATWQEISLRFSGEDDSRCAAVLSSLLAWREAARAKEMTGLVILDGSFVSAKEAPGDFDLVFSYTEETAVIIRNDPAARQLIDYQSCRTLGFLGDVFALPASLQQNSPLLGGLDMFDFDRQGRPKGVIEVPL